MKQPPQKTNPAGKSKGPTVLRGPVEKTAAKPAPAGPRPWSHAEFQRVLEEAAGLDSDLTTSDLIAYAQEDVLPASRWQKPADVLRGRYDQVRSAIEREREKLKHLVELEKKVEDFQRPPPKPVVRTAYATPPPAPPPPPKPAPRPVAAETSDEDWEFVGRALSQASALLARAMVQSIVSAVDRQVSGVRP